jgi:hypothetical protein
MIRASISCRNTSSPLAARANPSRSYALLNPSTGAPSASKQAICSGLAEPAAALIEACSIARAPVGSRARSAPPEPGRRPRCAHVRYDTTGYDLVRNSADPGGRTHRSTHHPDFKINNSTKVRFKWLRILLAWEGLGVLVSQIQCVCSSRSISARVMSLRVSRMGPVNQLRAEIRYQPPKRISAPPTVNGA